jgi:hypothetical protein
VLGPLRVQMIAGAQAQRMGRGARVQARVPLQPVPLPVLAPELLADYAVRPDAALARA